jgi:hypothetical protein
MEQLQSMTDEELRAWIKDHIDASISQIDRYSDDVVIPSEIMSMDLGDGFICAYPDCGRVINDLEFCSRHAKLFD